MINKFEHNKKAKKHNNTLNTRKSNKQNQHEQLRTKLTILKNPNVKNNDYENQLQMII